MPLGPGAPASLASHSSAHSSHMSCSGRKESRSQERGRVAPDVASVHADGAVTTPHTQPRRLVAALGVPPPDLQHQVAPGGIPGRRHPCRLTTGLERQAQAQRPGMRDPGHGRGQRRQPRHAGSASEPSGPAIPTASRH